MIHFHKFGRLKGFFIAGCILSCRPLAGFVHRLQVEPQDVFSCLILACDRGWDGVKLLHRTHAIHLAPMNTPYRIDLRATAYQPVVGQGCTLLLAKHRYTTIKVIVNARTRK